MMAKYYYLVLVTICFISVCNSQVFSKESLTYRMEENQRFGDSLKIPVYSSKIWGFGNSGIYFEKKNGKWGLFDSNKNKVILPHEIDSVLTLFHPPNIKSYILKQNGKWRSIGFDKKYKIKEAEPCTGLIITSKNKADNAIYNKGWRRFEVIYNGKRGIMNKDYQTIVPLKYDYILNLFSSLSEKVKDTLSFLTYNDSKVGIITNQARIEPTFEDVGISYPLYTGDLGTFKLILDKAYFGVIDNGKKGILDFNQKVLVPSIYDDLIYIESDLRNSKNEGVFIVRIKGKFGVIDAEHNILIPIEYDKVDYYDSTHKDDVFMVKKGIKYGLINSQNEIVKPISFTKEELKK